MIIFLLAFIKFSLAAYKMFLYGFYFSFNILV
jgi:hypothetical protein